MKTLTQYLFEGVSTNLWDKRKRIVNNANFKGKFSSYSLSSRDIVLMNKYLVNTSDSKLNHKPMYYRVFLESDLYKHYQATNVRLINSYNFIFDHNKKTLELISVTSICFYSLVMSDGTMKFVTAITKFTPIGEHISTYVYDIDVLYLESIDLLTEYSMDNVRANSSLALGMNIQKYVDWLENISRDELADKWEREGKQYGNVHSIDRNKNKRKKK